MTSAFGSEVQQALLRDGYFIAPGLFSVQALQEARRACKAHFRSSRVMHSHLGQHDVNAVMKLEQLWPLYSDARLLELVRVALAVERPLFTGHCDIARNRLGGWHKDSNGYFSTDDLFGDPSVRVYKCAVYLQDHLDGTGFHVRPGSHVMDGHGEPEGHALDTRQGDVVLFDVRLTHSGQFLDPVERRLSRYAERFRKNRMEGPWPSRIKDLYWKLSGKPDRYSIFFSFGAPNEQTMSFCKKTQERQNGQLAAEGLTGEVFVSPKEVLEKMLAAGFDVYDGRGTSPSVATLTE